MAINFSFNTPDLQTGDGIEVSVSCAVTYGIDPSLNKSNKAFPRVISRMFSKDPEINVEDSIREVISKLLIDNVKAMSLGDLDSTDVSFIESIYKEAKEDLHASSADLMSFQINEFIRYGDKIADEGIEEDEVKESEEKDRAVGNGSVIRVEAAEVDTTLSSHVSVEVDVVECGTITTETETSETFCGFVNEEQVAVEHESVVESGNPDLDLGIEQEKVSEDGLETTCYIITVIPEVIVEEPRIKHVIITKKVILEYSKRIITTETSSSGEVKVSETVVYCPQVDDDSGVSSDEETNVSVDPSTDLVDVEVDASHSEIVSTEESLTIEVDVSSSEIVSTEESSTIKVDACSSEIVFTEESSNIEVDASSSEIVSTEEFSTIKVDASSSEIVSTEESSTVEVDICSSEIVSTEESLTFELGVSSSEIVSTEESSTVKVDVCSSEIVSTEESLTVEVDACSSEIVSTEESSTVKVDACSSEIVSTEESLTVEVDVCSSEIVSTEESSTVKVDACSSEIVSTGESLNAEVDTSVSVEPITLDINASLSLSW